MFYDLEACRMEFESLIDLIRKPLPFPVRELFQELRFRQFMGHNCRFQILQICFPFSLLFSASVRLRADLFKLWFGDVGIEVDRHLGFIKGKAELLA